MSTARLLEDPREAAAWCARERRAGRSLGFVPTMGALHAGHLELVRRAAAENERALVSVFVNPLQFDEPADLASYPRELAADVARVGTVGCDLLFTGTLAGFFPEYAPPDAENTAAQNSDAQADWMQRIPLRDPGPAAAGLEGAFRKGHFEGVATIVARLFELVRPTRAYFGAKDYQQALVVRGLVPEGAEPHIVVCPTQREPDGLARSSRNSRLNPSQRARAVALSRGLLAARAAWRAGEREPARLVAAMRGPLAGDGIELEYAEVRDPDHWTATRPRALDGRARALVAAKVGPVRLIDNLALDAESVRAEEGDAAWEQAIRANVDAR